VNRGRVHLALLDTDGSSLLWCEREGGWALPCVEVAEAYASVVGEAGAALAELGLRVTFLRTPLRLGPDDDGRVDLVQLAESSAPLPDGYRFGPLPLPDRFTSGPPEHRSAILAALAQALADEADPPEQRVPWVQRGWAVEAEAWVDAELARLGRLRLGSVQQVKQWNITALWRVPAEGGEVWFKAAPPLALFCDEGRVVRALSKRLPGRVPQVLAHDAERRWSLLASFGAHGVDHDDVAQQRRVARSYASLQLEAAPWAVELLDVGAVDRRRAVFERQLPRLLEAEEVALLSDEERAALPDLVPQALTALDELSDLGLPETLVHGDLHLDNVALPPGAPPLFYDWTDACIAHPFFDLVPLLDFPDDPAAEALAPLKLAYLDPWLKLLPLPDLWRACDLGVLLGFAHHAISYQEIREATEPGARWELGGMTALALRRMLKLL
jgi:Ser/Thr protein kinase RdoA (MazF antagonist)